MPRWYCPCRWLNFKDEVRQKAAPAIFAGFLGESRIRTEETLLAVKLQIKAPRSFHIFSRERIRWMDVAFLFFERGWLGCYIVQYEWRRTCE